VKHFVSRQEKGSRRLPFSSSLFLRHRDWPGIRLRTVRNPIVYKVTADIVEDAESRSSRRGDLLPTKRGGNETPVLPDRFARRKRGYKVTS